MKPYAIHKAIDYIEQKIAKKAWLPGEKLSPLSQLASAAGVSPKTLWSAAAILKENGVLLLRKGSRLRVAGGDAVAGEIEKTFPRHSAPEKIARHIERDILNGHFQPGTTVGAIKELAARYGAGHITIRKALRILADEHIVAPNKKKYQVPQLEKSHYRNSICLVWEVGSSEEFKTRSERENQIMDTLERECSQAGIALHFAELNVDKSNSANTVFEFLKEKISAIGFLIHPIAYYYDNTVHRRYLELLRRCTTLKKPVAIIDEIVLFKVPDSGASAMMQKVFTVAAISAGKQMARYLLSLGHRKIAYISQSQNEYWSKARYEGMVLECRKSGFPDAISSHAIAYPASTIDSLLRQANLTEKQLKVIFPIRQEETDAPWGIDALAAPFKTYLQKRRRDLESLQNDARILAGLTTTTMNPRTFRYVHDRGMWWIGHDLLRILMESLFAKALAVPSITAWAVSNDNAAIFALSFLRKNRIKVPGGISVASFDNLPRASEAGLTSYDFNIPGLVHQALAFITRPARYPSLQHKRIVEVEGSIMPRETAARAP
jgi:DNA-binding LacI/PurR family transcriptional regulator